MIKHIVCFKLKDNSPEKKREAAEIEVGTDFLCSERSYDVILQVTLENREMLEAYQNDEYHCSCVKPYMHDVREASVAVDYDI